jgi:hypothetical protein
LKVLWGSIGVQKIKGIGGGVGEILVVKGVGCDLGDKSPRL